MAKRSAVWVVVDGNDAQVFPRTVRSTHRTFEAAKRAAHAAARAGHRLACVQEAQVIARMQQGEDWTSAYQATRGTGFVAVLVEVRS